MNIATRFLAVVACSTVVHQVTASPVQSDEVSYTAHEWGTFTSVQGADGVQIPWNSQIVTELPKFVYNFNKTPEGLELMLTKTSMYARQRLETPVIYFHSDAPISVSVDVHFPRGRVTEWYPRAEVSNQAWRGRPAISWPRVDITPRSSKEATRQAAAKYPVEKNGSHYYAAREADADSVRIGTKGKADEYEKYLFYRGVGNFDAPLRVSVPDANTGDLLLENTSEDVLPFAFVVRTGDGLMSVSQLEPLMPASKTPAPMGSPLPLDQGREQLGAMMREALGKAGLTISEAAAMVKTWDESWFAERGVRVLYILPRSWADTVLPLTLKPAAREVVRVFVGRAEVITPAVEAKLAEQIDRAQSDSPFALRDAAVAIRELGLDRFLETAFRRIAKQREQDRPFTPKDWELLRLASAPELPLTTAQLR